MKIVFAGTPDFAVPSLERLAERHEIAGVLSRPARPVGRGRRVEEPAVAAFARERGWPVLAPEKPNDPTFLDEFRRLSPDLVAIVSFGKILSEAFLAIPRLGCFNVHFSLLPEYRGASPVQSALADDRTETGVTVFRLVKRMDAGPVLGTRRVAIEPEETAGVLLARLGRIGADLLLETVGRIEDGTAVEVAQDEAKATYCRTLAKSDGLVDWSRPASEVVARFRAYTPWPGAFTWWTGRSMRIVLASVRVVDGRGEAGAVIGVGEEGAVVAAGQGAVRIEKLQPAGKREMAAGEFVRGYRLGVGEAFGSGPVAREES